MILEKFSKQIQSIEANRNLLLKKQEDYLRLCSELDKTQETIKDN